MNIPAQVAAGDSMSWADFPFTSSDGRSINSADYALSYSLRGPGAVLDLNATSSGSGWKTAMSTTQSAALNTGAANAVWFWQAYASKTGERILAGEGSLVVKPNLAALTGTYDGRTQQEKDLEAVRLEISSRINGGATVEYSIGSRQLKKEPISELIKLEDRLKMEVARQRTAQRVANGQGNPGKVMVRFSR